MSTACNASPVVNTVQHPIYQPNLTKAAQIDFTYVRALFEGVFHLPPAQHPVAQFCQNLMNLDSRLLLDR